ncbi:cyclin-like protein [Rhodocollybia butyracea]|uniref:Cyclin-like protein n=1 Tax=Rhodocollybia butyracea TaxID=206335 RepID=A0A9P5PRT8_9AGAR|nr:cyclin-like protein [Rhodocollybia butyracea]
MSSSIPVRRTTRLTKVTKDNENANAKPSRIMTRAKTQASSALAENARVTATTVASRAKSVETATEKTAVKRKREILGEVTELAAKPKASGKGKEKITSGDKSTTSATAGKSKATTKSRAPLREVGTDARRSLRSTAAAGDRKALKPIKEGEDRDEIIVDEPQVPAQSSRTTEPAVFKLIPHSSEQAAPSSCGPASVNDDLDREPVFKKRITENEQGRQLLTLDESQEEEERIAVELADVHGEDDENVALWDDLDAEDADDPLMASEYVHEIMQYMKELEIKTAPTADYMSYHSELDWEKRFILVEWVLQIHSRYNFLAESFFLFVNIMDRFLSLRPTVALSKLQLVGVSCFCTAVKFEEGVAPSTKELVLLTGEIYTAEEICTAERYVLKTIDFNLSFPGPMSWLRRGSKADDLDPVARTLAKYFLELACFSPALVATPTSLVAAASLWFARLILEREEWTPNLIHYTSYKEREILPVAEVLLNSVVSPVQSEHLYKKYASKRYMKCSVYVRKWALARFEAATEVNLETELPAIKMEIVDSRVAKIVGQEFSD